MSLPKKVNSGLRGIKMTPGGRWDGSGRSILPSWQILDFFVSVLTDKPFHICLIIIPLRDQVGLRLQITLSRTLQDNLFFFFISATLTHTHTTKRAGKWHGGLGGGEGRKRSKFLSMALNLFLFVFEVIFCCIFRRKVWWGFGGRGWWRRPRW